MIVRIPLPEYKPDQSNNSGVLLKAENVIPALDGYRSLPGLLTQSDAMAGTFQGGTSAIASDGSAYLLAGTASKLQRLSSAGAWTDLATGLSITGRWRFSQFGDYVVAVTGGATREVDLAAATASAIAGAPSATSVCVIGDHVVLGQAGGDISKVAWSAFRDHTGWTVGTNQAGEQTMQTGGAVQGVVGGEYGIVLQRERIVRMTRTGDADAPFQFDEISSNFGCAASATIAQAGRTIFFRSDRGFMALDDGQSLRPIGSEKVDRYFDTQVSRDDLERMFAAVDPQNKLVFWGVPGSPGTLWIYNFELDRWSTASLAFEGIFPGFTTSIGIDDLAVIYTNLDTMPYTLDDPRWSGGNPRLYLVDTSHQLALLSGDTLAAQMDLGYSEIVQGQRTRVRGVRFITDATGGVSVVMNAKARIGDGDDNTTAGTMRVTGKMPIRTAGRYISTSIRFAAATDWDYIQGIEIDCEAGGAR